MERVTFRNTNAQGQPVVEQVTIRVNAGGALATIYSDDLAPPTAKSNPFTVDNDGMGFFYAADTDYNIVGTTTGTVTDVSTVDYHIRELGVQKTADETENNNAVVQSDDELLFPVVSGEIWTMVLVLDYSSTTNAGFKLKFDTPGGSTGFWSGYALTNSTTVAARYANNAVGATVSFVLAANAVNDLLYVTGRFTAGATGSITLQWAQQAAHADDTTVHEGSFLVARRIGIT